MLMAVQAGYYSGIIGGMLVDKKANIINYSIAAGVSAVSFGGLAYTIQSDFGFFLQMVTIVLLFTAGLAASIATICSIVSIVKNFEEGTVSYLLVALLITYMKLAQAFDDAIHDAFFPDSSDALYLAIIGVIVTVSYVLGAITMRKVECGAIIDAVSAQYDPFGCFIFIITTAVFLASYWVFNVFLEYHVFGTVLMFSFLFLNFVMLGLAVFTIYSKAKKDGLNILKNYKKSDKPKDVPFGTMIKQTKYIMTLIATMCVVGGSYAYSTKKIQV